MAHVKDMKRLLSIVAFAVAILLVPCVSHAQGDVEKFKYEVEFQGLDDANLTNDARKFSKLLEQEKSPPASYAGLKRRADNDVKTIRRLLISEAYYGAQVEADIRPRDDERWSVIVRAQTGARYTIDAIDIALKSKATVPEGTQAAINGILKSGAPARADDILAAEGVVTIAPKNEGYPFAKFVRHEVIVDHANRNVDVIFHLDLGPKKHFGELEISGLETVKSSYVQRLIPWQVGDLYDQRRVDAFHDALSATGLFNTIRLFPVADENEGEASTLQLSVSEAQMRTISAGAGYSSTEGPSVEAGWTHRNFFGAQEKLELRALLSELEQSLKANLTKPNFLRPDQSLISAVELSRIESDAFTSYTSGASLGLERQLGARWAIAASGRLEYNRVIEADDSRNFLLAALPLLARYDGSDDLLDPRQGARLTLNVVPELGIDGNIFGFTTTSAVASAYQSFGAEDAFTLAARMKMGSIVGAGREHLPANRRFFAGGGGSVRGFGYQNVGPLDADGEPLGGLAILELGAEVRWRISERFGIVPFVDAGNVYRDNIPKFTGLRVGGGLGFRYYTDFAPIRLDLATPIDRRPGENRIQIYISIGQSF